MPTPGPPPTGHAAAAAHFFGQVLPRTATAQHKQNARERLAIRHARSPTFGLGRFRRQQRLDTVPQFIREQWLGHFRFLHEPGESTPTAHFAPIEVLLEFLSVVHPVWPSYPATNSRLNTELAQVKCSATKVSAAAY